MDFDLPCYKSCGFRSGLIIHIESTNPPVIFSKISLMLNFDIKLLFLIQLVSTRLSNLINNILKFIVSYIY